MLLAYEDKSAQAVCTFAYCEGPGHEPLIFEGRTTVGHYPPRWPEVVLADSCARGKLCLLEVLLILVCQHFIISGFGYRLGIRCD